MKKKRNVSHCGRDELDPRRRGLVEDAFTHVQAWSPQSGWLFGSEPRRIVLDLGARVWVESYWIDELPAGAVQVGDTLTTGYDEDGRRIVSVPVAWCSFRTQGEADSIMQMLAADAQMLSHVR
ncbi:MAG: hypothetical protein ACM31O_03820 [Bacteroidota bacterium]